MKHLFSLLLLAIHFMESRMQLCTEDTTNLTDSDQFFLQLDPIKVNQTELGLDRSLNFCESEEENSTCPVQDVCNPRENNECMCGCRLEESQRAFERRLCKTCDNFGILQDPNSLISFCRSSLSTPDYRANRDNSSAYCVRYTSVNDTTDFDVDKSFTKQSLSKLVSNMEESLRSFSNVLNRTIVGVYFKSKGQRCACLEAYKKWLCTTMLPLFEVRNTSKTCCNSTNATTSDGRAIIQRRPCLDVCHDVLQICPYYLPSRFQKNDRDEQETLNVIYGGYPAFDCPRMKTVENQTCENGTYATSEYNCMKFSSAHSVHLHSLHRLLSVVLFVALALSVW